MTESIPVTLDEVIAAQRSIAGKVHRTPLVGSTALGDLAGAPLFLKLECWQKTGSFKVRGALTKIATLSDDERARGLVTCSAGNHAQGVAYAAAAAGLPCTVVMPAEAPKTKIAATRGYGAHLELVAERSQLFPRALEIAEQTGATFIQPFDDPAIVAGQGTVGLEVLDDLPEAATVIVPIGGGGLISGVALAVKSRKPDIRVFGVEPEGAPSMYRSRNEGQAVHLDSVNTIADGLTAPFAGELNYRIVERYVDDLVLVTDDDIRRAMFLILERCKILAEPAGAAPLAALLSGKVGRVRGPVVLIVSGGNTDVATLGKLLGDVVANA
ncbi:MAG TPA: threonine/serine dehydratase [Thermomicrobiaceae bacterium]|nr:threonine/serine dehydratase [Thermomicrobiaceae bacterium]